jgi:pimeloyl-ACP methyl ester carboxylesterase
VIKGTSHWPQLDDPKGFDRLLDEFLTSIEENGKPTVAPHR